MVKHNNKEKGAKLKGLKLDPHHQKPAENLKKREALSAAAVSGWSGSGSGPDEDAAADAIQKFEDFCDNRGIELFWELPDDFRNGPVRGDPCGRTNKLKWSMVLLKEWGRYPADYFGSKDDPVCEVCCVLERMVVGGNAGFYGIAVPQIKSMFINAGTKSEEVRHTLHHELFHLVDWVDDKHRWDDPEWEEMNPDGFEYQEKPPKGNPFDLMNAPEGFLMGYGQKSVYEDKAVFVGAMMDKPQIVSMRRQQDEIIDDKAAYMKETLQTWCKQMDDERFWQFVEAGTVKPFEEDSSSSSSSSSSSARKRKAKKGKNAKKQKQKKGKKAAKKGKRSRRDDEEEDSSSSSSSSSYSPWAGGPGLQPRRFLYGKNKEGEDGGEEDAVPASAAPPGPAKGKGGKKGGKGGVKTTAQPTKWCCRSKTDAKADKRKGAKPAKTAKKKDVPAIASSSS